MTTTLTANVGELAETLHDLRQRFRDAARVEVARAVGESLREFAKAVICGSVRYPATARTACSAWDDAWEDPEDDLWHARGAHAEEFDADDRGQIQSALLPPALAMGLTAARWGFARTRQVGPALVIGLIVALAAYAGGPTVKLLLEAWSAANDLLNYPDPDRRP